MSTSELKRLNEILNKRTFVSMAISAYISAMFFSNIPLIRSPSSASNTDSFTQIMVDSMLQDLNLDSKIFLLPNPKAAVDVPEPPPSAREIDAIRKNSFDELALIAVEYGASGQNEAQERVLDYINCARNPGLSMTGHLAVPRVPQLGMFNDQCLDLKHPKIFKIP